MNTKYLSIYNYIVGKIENGIYEINDKLPSKHTPDKFVFVDFARRH